ncbi:MAG: UDP-N-acetylmuramate--L-alanine ligase [Pseudobacteriovorax sp.]|nr:UDP-N-acetylmuramate--L-alanine ligase [Pseudobacteriovorax sp.]
MKLQEVNSVYLIGILGSGMKPLAEISTYLGIKVSGSDLSGHSHKISHLAEIYREHLAENVDPKTSVIVYSTAISENNPELVQARKLGIPTLHRSEYLQLLSEGKKLIAVGGTHGKTTTTALIAHIFDRCGMKPTACIGGVRPDTKTSSYCGEGDFFITEADESDGTLLNFSPFASLVTNIDLDHLDFYKDLDDIIRTFGFFCKNVDPEGVVVFSWDDRNSRDLAISFEESNRIVFGKSIGANVRLLSFKNHQHCSYLDIMLEKERIKETVPLLGYHNIQNVLAAISIAHAVGIDGQEALKAISSFPGVERRLEMLLNTKNTFIFNDYAHNPGKVTACISAVRKSFSYFEIIVIFQPHRFSRVKTMYNEFIGAFANANTVLLSPLFAAGECDPGTYSPGKFAKDIVQGSGQSLQCFELQKGQENTQALGFFDDSKNQVFLFLGAGDISDQARQFKDAIVAKKEETI